MTKSTDYLGNFVYEDNILKYILTAEGKIAIDEVASPDYQYFLKDHLGNTRVVFNSDSVLQASNYYPFGMLMENFDIVRPLTGNENKYLYNGKELQSDFGLDWYDYGARFYDAQIARWHVIDNKAEKYFVITQYAYALNNPVLFLDPDGNDVKVSTTKNDETGRTTVTFSVTMSLRNTSLLSNEKVVEHAKGVRSQIEKSFSGFDSKTNTEYVTKVIFDNSEKDFVLEFTDNIKGGSATTTGNVDEIGNTNDNTIRVLLESVGDDESLQTNDETAQVGAHEYGHTVGLKHGGTEGSLLETKTEKNLMNQGSDKGTDIKLQQLEKAKEIVTENKEN